MKPRNLTLQYPKSEELFERAKKSLVGGVNSPVRAYRSVDGTPLFIQSGKGPMIKDLDGKEYIDYVLSYGPLILGHADERVIEAIHQAASAGTTFGAPTEMEVELAELVKDFFPAMEKIRFVNSGTEACMSAVRLARGYTGKDKIIKFSGNYHGHADSFLVQAGSGVATLAIPGNPGVTEGAASDTLCAPYNDLQSVEEIFKSHPDQIAAIIVEPVAGNIGLVLPNEGFLEGLKNLCRQNKALLVFDEVMTGFRVSKGGAQEAYGITPDLTCLGKVIGGGMPAAAFGGSAEIMNHLAPEGPVYQAGTLSGNPLAMAAGIATLKILKDEYVYQHIEKMGKLLEIGLMNNANEHGVDYQFYRAGAMFAGYFSETPIENYEQAQNANSRSFLKYFWNMLEKGIYFAPSPYEAGFLSLAHTEREIEMTLEANRLALYKK